MTKVVNIREQGVWIINTACIDCLSNDNLSIYEKSDGSVDGFCRTPHCGESQGESQYKSHNRLAESYLGAELGIKKIIKGSNKPNNNEGIRVINRKKSKKAKKPLTKEEIDDVVSKTISKGRNFRSQCDKELIELKVRTEFNGVGAVQNRYYPIWKRSLSKKPVGFKKRIVLPEKDFRVLGLNDFTVDLFGEEVCKPRKGSKILIEAGEENVLAAKKMIKMHKKDKWKDIDVVCSSHSETAQYKQIQAKYDFFDSYEVIILAMDNDEAGKIATENLLEILPMGKVKIMQKPNGDANDLLIAGKSKQWIEDFFNADKPKIEGIAGSSTIFEDILEQTTREKIPLPPFLEKANKMLEGGLSMNTFNIIAAQTSVGKCHGKDTEILMYDSSIKYVQDVKVGDKVMGIDGSPRSVLSLHTGVDDMYKVTQVKGVDYTVNSRHELSLRMGAESSNKNFKRGVVYNIPVNEYLELSGAIKHSLKGYKADLKELGKDSAPVFEPYMIGLWLADGTTAKPQYTIANKDKELVKEFYNFAERNNYGINICPSNIKAKCTGYDLSGGFLVKLRDELNLLNNKHIPLNYMLASYEDRLQLLAGILDGDGYLVHSGYEIIQKSEELSDGIVYLAKSVGLSVTRSLKFSKCQGFEGAYYHRIFIFGNTSKIPNKLARKSAPSYKKNREPLNTGVTVTPIGKGNYYGFEVSGDHLYCLSDMTVVHNSTVTNEILYHLVMNSKDKVGVISLEASKGVLGEQLLSLHLGKRISSLGSVEDKVKFLKENKDKSDNFFKDKEGDDRFYIMDDRSYLSTPEEVFKQIDKLIRGLGVKLLIIDVLSDLMDNLDINEQAEFMGRIKKLIAANEIVIIGIMHMRKEVAGKDSNPHLVNEHSIYGSSTAVKSASTVLLMSRDKVSEDEEERNTTRVMLTKNRGNGITGKCCELYYDYKSHKLYDKENYVRGY